MTFLISARQHLAVMVTGERTRTARHRFVHLRQGFLADIFCPARFRAGPHDRPGQALGAAFVLRQGGPFADRLKQRHQLLGDPLGDVPDLEGIVTPRRGERGVHAIAFLHVGQHVTVGNRHHGSAPLHLPARRRRLAAAVLSIWASRSWAAISLNLETAVDRLPQPQEPHERLQ
jgi:hypothetical protein